MKGYTLKEDVPCDCCGSEVPLSRFSNLLLCEFCAKMIGNTYDQVTKAMLCQGLNVLYAKLKPADADKGAGR